MERKIGEIFEYNGEWYQCVLGNNCHECDFSSNSVTWDIHGELLCPRRGRSDDTSVVFKKLKKVGDPLKINGRVYQGLIAPYGFNNCSMCAFRNILCKEVIPCYDDYIFIEIKQNKEDMEKNNNAKHSNSESIGKNLKTFDLEAAKAGKPVCTRDGRKARIICFDMNANSPIVALVDYNGQEVVVCCHNDGRNYHAETTYNDLMMLLEKKEGWANVSKFKIYDSKEEALSHKTDDIISTVKVEWYE